MSASMAAFRRPLRTILYLLSLLCAQLPTCLPEALAGVRDCAANPLITVEMYEEIRDGMSPREVQHILGTSGMQELRHLPVEDTAPFRMHGKTGMDRIFRSQVCDFNQISHGTELRTVIKMIGQRGTLESQEISAADKVVEWMWVEESGPQIKASCYIRILGRRR